MSTTPFAVHDFECADDGVDVSRVEVHEQWMLEY